MPDLSKTITAVRFSHNPVPFGQGFSISAHVTPGGPHHVHGDVEFFADGDSLQAPVRTDSTGVAVIGVPGGLLKPGTHEVSAKFAGDGYNAASESEPVNVVLSPDPMANPGPLPPVRGSVPDDVGFPIDTKASATAVPRQDGPTVAEFIAAGYDARNYPPSGYAAKSTQAEIDAAITQQEEDKNREQATAERERQAQAAAERQAQEQRAAAALNNPPGAPPNPA
jgi:hypothetical protein